MWLNVGTSGDYPRRFAIARLYQEDFVNAGLRSDVAREMLCGGLIFDEVFVRRVLNRVYANALDWVLLQADYDIRSGALLVLVANRLFDQVKLGDEYPLLKRLDDVDATNV